MTKKLIKIGKKHFLADDDDKKLEEVEVDESVEETPEVEEVEEKEEEKEEVEEEEEEEVKEDVEAKVQKAAEEVVASLGLDKIHQKLDALTAGSVDTKEVTKKKKVADLLDLEALMKKDVEEMTAKEKIMGFFQAAVQSNHTVLKALSEGTAADGGYLFPDEFRAELIRDLEEGNYMRNEVRVIPMVRDVLKAPTLTDRPRVSWTDENATKSTTTAHFYETTLTVYKMAAINAIQKGRTELKSSVKKSVNCWNTLTYKMRAISSQALPVMA